MRRRERNEARRARRADWKDRPAAEPWRLRFPLRTWQQAALQAWTRAGNKGVIEAATGTGKTAVALGAAQLLHERLDDRLRVAIVVPSVALVGQWRQALERDFAIPPSLIGEVHGSTRMPWTSKHTFLIAVINSARTGLAPRLDIWRTKDATSLLVVDECHRAGSKFNSRIFESTFEHSLGLSATPERDDLGHHVHVYPGVGAPVYRYPLLKALDDGTLAPVISVNLYVDFTITERFEWNHQSARISDLIHALKREHPRLDTVPDDQFLAAIKKLAERQDPLALSLVKALSERRALLAGARDRLRCTDALLDWLANRDDRTIVFHETIVSAERSHARLVAAGARAGIDHSQLPSDRRIASLQRFRTDRDHILVAVRSLDEGIDVPGANTAVIAAGSRSKRQRIQRVGRVLRHTEGKRALVVSILVRDTPEEHIVGNRDVELFGKDRVRHHQWPLTPLERATGKGESTYRVKPGRSSVVDRLTISELGIEEYVPARH